MCSSATGHPRSSARPNADDDDEPVVKGPQPIGLPPPVGDLCGGRPCLTEEDLDPASLLRTLPTTQAELNEEAARLGEKQGRRRKFWNQWNVFEDTPMADAFITSAAVRKKLADLDLVFATKKPVPFLPPEPEHGVVYRHPSVDLLERPVLRNPEARKIYNHAYYAVMNEPEEESYFHKVILGICEHTNPCKPIIDQQRANVASGMDPEEAVKQSLIRLGVEQGIALLAPGQPDDLVTEGPRIPVGLPVAHPEFEAGKLDPEAAGTEPAPKLPMQMTAKPPKPPSTATGAAAEPELSGAGTAQRPLTEDEKWAQAEEALKKQEADAAPRGEGEVGEAVPDCPRLIAQVEGKVRVTGKVRTDNAKLRAQGFTETWYVTDRNGTRWTLHFNKRSGQFTGAHESSLQ